MTTAASADASGTADAADVSGTADAAGASDTSGASRAAARAGRRSGALLLILGALSALGPLTIDMYLPALPQIGAEMAAGPAQVQLSLTACLIGVSLGQVLAGPLSDGLGRRGPLLAGLCGYAAASLACAFAPSAEVLTGLRLLQGLAGGAALVIVRAVVRDLYEGAAIARVLATLMLVSGLAPILAPVLGAQLLAVTTWRGVFAALMAIGVLLLVAVLAGVRETLPAERREAGGLRGTARSFGRLLRDRAFLAAALAGGLAFAAMFAYISGSSFVLQGVYRVSPQGFSLIFGLNALALVLAGQLGGRLAGRIAPARLVAAGLVLGLLSALGLVAATTAGAGLPVVVGLLFTLMGGAGLAIPGSAALALSVLPPQVAGSASALLGVLQFALGAAAAPLTGLAGAGSAVPMAVVMSVLMAAALAAFTGLHRGASAQVR